jgi:hypothetical protein
MDVAQKTAVLIPRDLGIPQPKTAVFIIGGERHPLTMALMPS